jgi:hypothetical protein
LEDLITIFHPELLPNHKLFSSEIRINWLKLTEIQCFHHPNLWDMLFCLS